MTGTLHGNNILWMVYYLIWGISLCYLSVIDIKYRRVPNRVLAILAPLVLCSLLLQFLDGTGPWNWIQDRAISVLIFCALIVDVCISSKNSIGGGDIKLIGLLSLGLGSHMLIQTLMLALVAALLCWAIYKRRHQKELHIPIVPYLTGGYLLTALTRCIMI